MGTAMFCKMLQERNAGALIAVNSAILGLHFATAGPAYADNTIANETENGSLEIIGSSPLFNAFLEHDQSATFIIPNGDPTIEELWLQEGRLDDLETARIGMGMRYSIAPNVTCGTLPVQYQPTHVLCQLPQTVQIRIIDYAEQDGQLLISRMTGLQSFEVDDILDQRDFAVIIDRFCTHFLGAGPLAEVTRTIDTVECISSEDSIGLLRLSSAAKLVMGDSLAVLVTVGDEVAIAELTVLATPFVQTFLAENEAWPGDLAELLGDAMFDVRSEAGVTADEALKYVNSIDIRFHNP